MEGINGAGIDGGDSPLTVLITLPELLMMVTVSVKGILTRLPLYNGPNLNWTNCFCNVSGAARSEAGFVILCLGSENNDRKPKT